jgi:TPR repeat protein
LGWSYRQGVGVGSDVQQAADWFRKSAMQGNAYGQHALGLLYRDGIGVKPNAQFAYAWLDLSAKADFQNAAIERDKLGAAMNPADLAQARNLSANWQPGHAIGDAARR